MIEFPSPNFALRDRKPSFIIIHGMCMESDDKCLETLCSEELEVSCHYFIDLNGELFKLVDEENIAWHAGVSYWRDLQGLNEYSIGIELSNPGVNEWLAYNEATYQTLIPLLQEIMERYDIPPENVLGHSDIAPDRKDDPSEHFDWARLEKLGLAFAKRR